MYEVTGDLTLNVILLLGGLLALAQALKWIEAPFKRMRERRHERERARWHRRYLAGDLSGRELDYYYLDVHRYLQRDKERGLV